MLTFSFLATFYEKSAIIIAANYFETTRSGVEGELGVVGEGGGWWGVAMWLNKRAISIS